MDMNSTPSGERIHIGIFGKRNAGKSSLMNAITGQNQSIVSDVLGTTTDPVRRAMELLPLGPVVMIDTPGLDDEGALGQERVKKTRQILGETDLALLVTAADTSLDDRECELIAEMKERKLPFLIVVNKTDQLKEDKNHLTNQLAEALKIDITQIYWVSAKENIGIDELKQAMARLLPDQENTRQLVGDLLQPQDMVILVVPIDSAAPKGRLILPQQQVIRDCLEAGAVPVVCRETELKTTLEFLKQAPRLVITDSQAFGMVSKIVPPEIPLTSFSILMARYKGDLKTQVEGARAIETLHAGAKLLISEGCTHHRQCDDIGTVKLPRWLKEYTGLDLDYTFTSGGEFPEDLTGYDLVIHCGGCTLNPREMRNRIARGSTQGVPITNYGVMIAYIHGILDRVIQPFPGK